jgi:hypothetical protein
MEPGESFSAYSAAVVVELARSATKLSRPTPRWMKIEMRIQVQLDRTEIWLLGKTQA